MMRSTTLELLCYALTWLHAPVQAQSSDSPMPTATVANGTIIGTTTSLPAATAPVDKFLGIPFAQSPPERFSPPQSAEAYNGTLMAQALPPACVQQFVYPEAVANFTKAIFNYPPPPAGESEDCLYLNVFVPSNPAPAGGRAVMFWIYGGSFQFGTGSLASYDGSAFAAYNDVVLVTHNYRTNVFGFPGSSELPAAERNLGLLDQRMALQWVQDNIEAFGGDPSKVTIFGESAGSFSVDAHVTSFTTEDAPFRAAIMESGQTSYQALDSATANNDASFSNLATAANCTTDVLECLRALPATTVKAIIEQDDITFPPVIDNYTYFANRAVRRADGQFAQVPLLIGTNADEGRIFALGQTNLTQFIHTTFGVLGPSFTQQVADAFPVTATMSDYDQISVIISLIVFQCGSAYLADQNVRLDIPTWRYLYNASFPNASPVNGLLRVYHGSEIISVFQTYPGGPVNPVTNDTTTVQPSYLPPTAQQDALARYVNWAWASFAKNPLLGPGWGKLGSFPGPDVGVLGGTTGSIAGVELVSNTTIDAQCAVFRSLFERGAGVPLR